MHRLIHNLIPIAAFSAGFAATIATIPAAAKASPVASPVCSGLSMHLSDDKNYYIFTATSSTASSDIAGYTFHFGDHESYRLVFGSNAAIKDRHTATTTHTYRDAGAYTASVQVNAVSGASSPTIPACQVSVAITPTGTTLPNTGAGNVLGIAVIAACVANIGYWIRIRRHHQT